MALSLRTKILLAVGAVGILCTTTSVYIARQEIHRQAVDDLVEKSQAILSRLDVGAKYVAGMHTLDGIIDETVKKYPTGVLPEEQKLKILRSVPIYAAFQIGMEGAESEHYQF